LWVEKYLGNVAYKRLILSNDKSLFTGRALIDDRTKYGVTEFKGEHIHFDTDKFPDWNSVLEYLM
jgi:5'(3')-deoxyribonucleotidase